MAKNELSGIKVITSNRRASFEYQLEDRWEAGLVLLGSEIKSIRAGRVNIGDGFVVERDGELWLLNMHIALYEAGRQYGHRDARRPRKLLLHKREIARMIRRIRERGMTIIPTQLYLRRGRAKVELASARGKRQYDKRQAIAKRDSQRQVQRALKGETTGRDRTGA